MYPSAAAPRRASGATAIAAAVLAFAGAVVWAGAAVPTVSGLVEYGTDWFGWADLPGRMSPLHRWLALTDLLLVILLIFGGALLLVRSLAGQLVTALACGYVLVSYAAVALEHVEFHQLSEAPRYLGHSPLTGTFGTGFEAPWFAGPALLVFPVLTLVCTLLPSTTRWRRDGGAYAGPTSPPVGYAPAPPGYAPQAGHLGVPGQYQGHPGFPAPPHR
ncbi:hypothetical protein [Nocardia thailandica]